MTIKKLMIKTNIKFLIDVDVGRKIENYLMENGYDILTIRSINPHLSDNNILKLAVEEKRMLITMDKDFGELVYKSGLNHEGVLLLRFADKTGEDKVEILKTILKLYENKLKNNFCVFHNNFLRIKK